MRLLIFIVSVLLIAGLALMGCAHRQIKDPPMGGVSLIPCDADNCGKPVVWEVL